MLFLATYLILTNLKKASGVLPRLWKHLGIGVVCDDYLFYLSNNMEKQQAIIVNGIQPMSEEEMFEMYGVDKNFRETERIVHNNWTTTAKDGDGNLQQILNHQTKLYLKPKFNSLVPEWSIDVIETLLGDDVKTWNAKEVKETGNLGGLMLTDIHANVRDVQNNTMTKRMKIVNDRITRVMDRLLRFDPEKLIIPNLGDMNNSDVKHLTSSLKTPMQDTVSMEESYKRILEREIGMLESMKQYGLPIKYIKLSGNHDGEHTSLASIALQYYFKDSDIDVDTAKHRYYEIRGKTMIALSHGDRGEGQKLFQMIVDECISKSKKRLDHLYAYLGHHHKKIIHQEGPLEIKNIQAPAPKTERCEKYGHDMKQSMSGFIWNKNEGQVAEVRG